MLKLILSALAVFFAVSASAEPKRNCAPRPMVLERLASSYGETRQSIGPGNNNAVIEVFASTETGSWMITVTKPDGETCLVASGRSYENLSEPLCEVGDPT